MNTTIKPTKARYTILAAVFINVVINYMDRSNISVGAFFISQELGLSTIQIGYLFSAFGLAYALSQIPGGYLADKLNIRYFYSFCLITSCAVLKTYSPFSVKVKPLACRSNN